MLLITFLSSACLCLLYIFFILSGKVILVITSVCIHTPGTVSFSKCVDVYTTYYLLLMVYITVFNALIKT